MDLKTKEFFSKLGEKERGYFSRIVLHYPKWDQYLKINNNDESIYLSIDVPSHFDPNRKLSFWSENEELMYSFGAWHEHLEDSEDLEIGYANMFDNIEDIMSDQALACIGYSGENWALSSLTPANDVYAAESIFQRYPKIDKIEFQSWTGKLDKVVYRK